MSATTQARRLALAAGDPNGIGPEIALKALAALPADARARITLFGPPSVLERTAVQLGLASSAGRPSPWPARASCRLQRRAPATSTPWPAPRPWPRRRAAIEACRRGEFDAVVACPHHETAIHQAGIAFSGYPSLVARVCGQPEDSVFLMLVGGGLRIVHVDAARKRAHGAWRGITPELVADAARAGSRACALLGVPRPSIGVFGINPHASEGGLFGPEDEAVVEPAVRALRAEGLHVDGPQGADVLLAQRRHDSTSRCCTTRATSPSSCWRRNAASALSIGAEVLLSSVGHGSAMDIAGRGIADPGALLRTIHLLSGLGAHPGVPSGARTAVGNTEVLPMNPGKTNP